MPGSGPSVGPVDTTGHTQSIEVKLKTHMKYFKQLYGAIDSASRSKQKKDTKSLCADMQGHINKSTRYKLREIKNILNALLWRVLNSRSIFLPTSFCM
jgi:hypothetical protein